MPRKYALIICLLMIIGSTILVFNNIAVWLSRNDMPVPADLIICLSGEHRIAKAAQLQDLANKVLLWDITEFGKNSTLRFFDYRPNPNIRAMRGHLSSTPTEKS